MSDVKDLSQHETPLLEKFPPLFRNRNFLLLWAGYVISALGDRIHFLVMLKLLWQLKHLDKLGTQETAQLNVMMLLPFLFIGPFSGVIADRLPRRMVMITADFARVCVVVIARTLFLAVPAASSWHDIVPGLPDWFPQLSWIVLILLLSELVVGIFSAFFSPARTALLPNLVSPGQLLRANSMTNAAGTIASLVGFAVGGELVKRHLDVAMYVDAATFLCSAVLLMSMKRTAQIAGSAMSEEKRTGVISEFMQGVRYLLEHKHAMQVIWLMFLFWCAGAIILSGLTGILTKYLNVSGDDYGRFMAVVGLGMMSGAAVVSIARRGIPKEIGIAWSMLLVGVFFLLFSLPKHWLPALILLTICAFFGAVLLVSLDTLLQRIVPDRVRGRVMAVRDMLANVGLVGMALPLAINPNIDEYILIVLRVVAVLIIIVGAMLVWYYYGRQTLPLPIAIARRFAAGYLSLWKGFEMGNAGRVPVTGPVIFVSNHTTAYDPLILQTASKRRFVQFMMAKEYYEKKPFYWFYKSLRVIPVNRTGNDTASIRTAIRSLKDGACIGMFPEGKISEDGRMNKGRPGVALLALMSGATVVPAYIRGTQPHGGMLKDFMRRSRVAIFTGRPLKFDDIEGHDDKARDEATARIMGAITALRDRFETDPVRRTSAEEEEPKNKSVKEKK